MTTNPKLKPVFKTLKQQTNIDDICSINHHQQPKLTKILQRKCSNSASNSGLLNQKSKKIDKQISYRFEYPRYITASPLKMIPLNIKDGGSNSRVEAVLNAINDIKTERNENSIQKSMQNKLKLNRTNEEEIDYYKYWKKKAKQYQQYNFELHRFNSSLQQQNEILKYKLDKLQKKLLKYYQQQPMKLTTKIQNCQKLQNYYKLKIEQLLKKLNEQQIIINKQDIKIKQLSKYISQNIKLKSLLDNMQQKYSQMKSICSKQNSRSQSIDKIIHPPPTHKKSLQLLQNKFLNSTQNSHTKSAFIHNQDIVNQIWMNYVSTGQINCFQTDQNYL